MLLDHSAAFDTDTNIKYFMTVKSWWDYLEQTSLGSDHISKDDYAMLLLLVIRSYMTKTFLITST